MAKQLNVNLSFTADTKQAKAQLASLRQELTALGSTGNLSGNMITFTDKISNAANTAYRLRNALDAATNVDTGKLNLTKLNQSLKANQLSLSQVRKEFTAFGNDGRKAFLTLASSIQTADAPLVNLGGRFKELATTFSNTIRWQLASSAIHMIQSELSQAYNYAKDLDKSLNDIRIVSGASADEMAKFAEKANKAARALSQTTSKYADAALIFYQQGLADDEVEERTAATLKMASVTGEAADDVSSYMTAVWNNFNKAGDESADHYGDIMTKLGAATAASTEEIAEGLEKFASVADTIGLSFEYASSAVTTVVDRTRQSAEVVGTALKTIFSRIQGLKLGETLDDGTTLNKYSQGLASVGINIKDASGELRDMDDILDDIGATWGELNKDQQVALAQTVAGVRQYNQFMSLFDNWDFMEQNLEWAYGAEGTLDEQAGIYAESWEAASKRVQAAAEDIYNTLIDNDAFITLLNGTEDVLVAINGLIDAMGGLPGVISLIGVAVTKVFEKQVAAGIQSTMYAMADAKAILYNTNTKILNKFNLGKGREHAQTSSEKLRTDAAANMQAMGAEMALNGMGSSAVAYQKIGELQEALLLNADNLTASEKAYGQAMVERAQIQAKILLEAESETAELIKQLDFNNQLNNLKGTAGGKYDYELEVIQQNLKGYRKIYQIILDIIQLQESSLLLNEEDNAQIQEKINKKYKELELTSKQYSKDDLAEIAASPDYRNTQDVVDIFKEEFTAEDSDLMAAIIGLETSGDKTLAKTGSQMAETVFGTTDALKDQSKAAGQYTVKAEQTKAAIEGLGKGVINMSTAMTRGLSGISSLSMGLFSFSNVINTVTHALDDNHVSFSEVLSVITSLSMGLPIVISGFKDIKAAMTAISKLKYGQVAQEALTQNVDHFMNKNSKMDTKKAIQKWNNLSYDERKKTTFNQFMQAERTNNTKQATQAGVLKQFSQNLEVAKVGTDKLTISTLKQAASSTIAGNSTLKLVTVLGKYAIIAAALVLIGKKVYDAITADARALKEAKEAASEASDEFERVKSAYDDLKSSIENYNSQKEAIAELTKGTTEWYEAIQKANESVLSLLDTYPELASMMSTDENGMLILSDEAQDQVLRSQQAVYKNAQRNLYTKQANVNTAENKDAITNFTRNVDTNAQERSIITSLLNEYQENGNATLSFNDEILAEKFNISVEDASRLIDNGIKELIVSLDNNTNATDLLNEQSAASTLSQHMAGYEESDFKDSLNAYQALMSSSGTVQVESSKSYMDLSKDEIIDMYAEAIGADPDDFTHRSGDGITYGDTTLSYKDDIKEFIKNEAADMVALDYTQKFSDAVNELYSSFDSQLDENKLGHNVAETISKGLTEALSSSDPQTAMADFVNTLNDEEFSQLEKMNNSKAINSFYETNKDYFTQLGIKDAQAFQQAYDEALKNRDSDEANENSEITKQEEWKSSLEDLASTLDVDSNAVEGYAETLRSLYPDLVNNNEATLDAVERHIQFSQGFDSLVETLDDYDDILSDANDNSWASAEALAAVGNSMEQLLGVPVSNTYVSDYLKEIKALAEGDMSALEELEVAAAKDYVISNLTIPEEDKNEINSFIDYINGLDVSMGITAKVDDQNFINQMNEMIEAGKITAEEVNTALGAIGYSAKVDYKEIAGPTTEYDQTITGSGALGKFMSFHIGGTTKAKTQVPVLNGKITRTSTPSSLGSSISASQTAKDDGGSKNEMERYYTVSNQLETLASQYEKISSLKEQAYGADKLKYIDQEIDKQDQLIEKQKEYIAQIQANLKLDKSRIKAYGAKFDEDGNITNYRTLFKKYGQDETFQKYLENYQSTVHLLEDADSELTSKIIERNSLKYEQIISTFDYGLEQDEKALEVMEKMSKHLSDDIYKTAEAFAVLMTGLDGKSNRVDILKHDMSEYISQKETLDEAWKNGELNEADYVEGLNNTMDSMLDMVDTYEELIDTVKEYYGNTLKQAQEELKHYTDQIDNALKKLQHFQKVQELSGQGTDYETTLELLSAQMQVTKDSFDIAREWYDSRAEDEAAIRERLAAINKETNPVEWEIENQKLRDAMDATQEAYDSMADYREQYLELAEEQYKTTIDKIAAYASSALAGDNFLNLDSLLDSMQNVSTRADEYLTKTNQLYETEKLRKQVLADMDKTSNKAAKERLNNFTKEIDAAQQQTELSNLELEILQAKYKQLQAQIALEEAQNAKNTVRLSRDNEGNYGYIYTADKDNIADAEQDLDDADNDLYNIRLKAFNNYSEKKIQAEKDLNDKIKEIWQDETLSYEEKEKEIQRITEEHYAIIDAYTDLATIAQEEDARIQADAWAAAYSKQSLDSTNWKDVVQDCMDQATTASKEYHEAIDPMIDTTKEKYDTLSDAIKGTVDQSDALAKEVNETVIPTLDDQIDEVDRLTTAYGQNLQGIADVVKSLKEDYIPSIQDTIENIKELVKAQENLNKVKAEGSGSEDGNSGTKSTSKDVDKNGGEEGYSWQVKSSDGSVLKSGSKCTTTLSAITAANNYYKSLSNATVVSSGWNSKKTTYTITVSTKVGGGGSASPDAGAGRYSSTTVTAKDIAVEENGKKTYKAIYNGVIYQGSTQAQVKNLLKQAYSKNHTSEETAEWLQTVKIKSYDTGGYTGDWGDTSGKLAMLHRKELVLNAEDTKNFLAGINVVRDISKAIDLQAFYSNTSNYSSAIKPISNASTLQQEVMIKAEFPNATNHTEIEQAFDTLINKAAQYANRRD